MTFAILARDDDGAIGMAVSSSSPAVGARCIHLRARVGGVASQNITDPRLGPTLLDLMAAGRTAVEAMGEVTKGEADVAYRQLMTVDSVGNVGAYSGDRTLGTYATAEGRSVVAAGNLLSNPEVPAAIVAAFEAADGGLEARLVTALAAGEQAGGEAGPVQSAAVSVVRDVSWRVTDLRVDLHDDPIAELSRLLEVWAPLRDDYVTRALRPGTAPSFAVPGDE
jgi:uncharacterized Ntn-hydrolase superfamily protein